MPTHQRGASALGSSPGPTTPAWRRSFRVECLPEEWTWSVVFKP